jgi:hypothetical protein
LDYNANYFVARLGHIQKCGLIVANIKIIKEVKLIFILSDRKYTVVCIEHKQNFYQLQKTSRCDNFFKGQSD